MEPEDEISSDDEESPSDELLREVAKLDDPPSAPLEEERAMGTRLGRFLLCEELGRGGMGIVYRAVDERLRRNVALKVLPSDRRSDPRRRARFLVEARSLASVVHANTATVYEIGEDGEHLYIAMELVVGRTLRARLAKGPLAIEDVLRIAKGIARGLAAAHAQGLVHRDLKPENVMISEEGEPKILDFGLAKLRHASEAQPEPLGEQPTDAPSSTEDGKLVGTPAYMSPEQAAGRAVDARSDLFSLGVILYEALSARRPFVGETSFETLAAVMRDEPEGLADVSPEVPPEVAAIVFRCLAKSPADRPASAKELLELLELRSAPPRPEVIDVAPRGRSTGAPEQVPAPLSERSPSTLRRSQLGARASAVIEALYADPTLRIEACNNLLLLAWSDAPNVEQMRTFRAQARALNRRYPDGVALFNAVLAGTPRFSEGVREEARRLMADSLMRLGAAHLILVGGLGGAAARAFVSAAILLARNSNPARVVSSADQASAWLEPRLVGGPVAWAPGDVRLVIDRFLGEVPA